MTDARGDITKKELGDRYEEHLKRREAKETSLGKQRLRIGIENALMHGSEDDHLSVGVVGHISLNLQLVEFAFWK